MSDTEKKRQPVDWEKVAIEYRAGIRSLKDIGAEFGVSDAGIIKRAKRDGWTRDLSAKIKAKAEALVSAKEVSAEVSAQAVANERQMVDASAAMMAEKLIGQRSDVQRARGIVNKLWEEISGQIEHNEEFESLGELLRKEDQFGNDKLNDAYMYAISLPQKVKSVKLLADAIKTLIELERKILRIDSMPDPIESAARGAAQGAAAGMGDGSRSILAGLLAELTDDKAAA